MIRAILHLLNDQPLSVDLVSEPKPDDLTVVCTNVKTIDFKKPVFIDYSDSTFVFPMAMIRFVEILRPEAERDRSSTMLPSSAEDDADELEIDEDFLRRVREA